MGEFFGIDVFIEDLGISSVEEGYCFGRDWGFGFE